MINEINSKDIHQILSKAQEDYEKFRIYNNNVRSNTRKIVDWLKKQKYYLEFLLYELFQSDYVVEHVDYEYLKNIIQVKESFNIRGFEFSTDNQMSIMIRYYDKKSDSWIKLETVYFPVSDLFKMKDIAEKLFSSDNSSIDNIINRKLDRIKDYKNNILDCESEIKNIKDSIKREEEDIKHVKTWRK